MLQFVGDTSCSSKTLGSVSQRASCFFFVCFLCGLFFNPLWWCTNSSARKARGGRALERVSGGWEYTVNPVPAYFPLPLPYILSSNNLSNHSAERAAAILQTASSSHQRARHYTAGGERSLCKQEGTPTYQGENPPTFPFCSDTIDDFRSSSMTLPICWVLLSGASSQQQIRNV